jgi:hypothetical protein
MLPVTSIGQNSRAQLNTSVAKTRRREFSLGDNSFVTMSQQTRNLSSAESAERNEFMENGSFIFWRKCRREE